ncbi:MAG: hypothetical protein LCH98_02980 [Actinobacteria bacterium]|nr:hypothetical protein [Actinomycetota bacterium]
MSELPVSVRLALWVTAAYAGRVALPDALRTATGDLDLVGGRTERLQTWHDLGERAVLVALPHPGAPGLLPRGREVLAAAVEAGECVFVPGLGDALVPTLAQLGPVDAAPLDRIGSVRWAAYSGDPVPVHEVDALDLREVERGLGETLVTATATLEALDARSWPTDGLRELAEARLAGGRWGLPDGLSERARRVIARAATLGTVADLGLDQLRDAHSLEVTARRREELLRLRREGDHALAAATNVAALHLAGWRGPDRD